MSSLSPSRLRGVWRHKGTSNRKRDDPTAGNELIKPTSESRDSELERPSNMTNNTGSTALISASLSDVASVIRAQKPESVPENPPPVPEAASLRDSRTRNPRSKSKGRGERRQRSRSGQGAVQRSILPPTQQDPSTDLSQHTAPTPDPGKYDTPHRPDHGASVTSDKPNHPSHTAASQSPKKSIKRAHPAAAIHLRDLQSIEKVGQGYYGDVHLVKHVDTATQTETLFALKVIDRTRFPKKADQKALANEIVIMRTIDDHPFHTRLMNAYRSPKHVYLLLSYAPHLSLANHIQPGIGLNDFRLPRYYAASIILALRHIHSVDICHRDIKCGNLLIGGDYNILVCDYGFARILPLGERTVSIAGTIPYNAPEQFLQKPYDHSVDIWALGICVFEMLFGRRPFAFGREGEPDDDDDDDDPDEMPLPTDEPSTPPEQGDVCQPVGESSRKKLERRRRRKKGGARAAHIIHRGIHIPASHADDPGCTPQAVSFITQVLDFFWASRLGNNSDSPGVDYSQLMNHEWFEGIDWDALERKELPVPGTIEPLPPAPPDPHQHQHPFPE